MRKTLNDNFQNLKLICNNFIFSHVTFLYLHFSYFTKKLFVIMNLVSQQLIVLPQHNLVRKLK